MFEEDEFAVRLATLKEIEDVFESLANKYATQPARGRGHTIQMELRHLLRKEGITAVELEKRHQELLEYYRDSQISEGFMRELHFFFECGNTVDSIRRFVLITPERKVPCVKYIIWVAAGIYPHLQREKIIAEIDRKSATDTLPSVIEKAYRVVTSWQKSDLDGSTVQLHYDEID